MTNYLLFVKSNFLNWCYTIILSVSNTSPENQHSFDIDFHGSRAFNQLESQVKKAIATEW